MKAPNDKGLSDDQICIELMKNARPALVVVHKMVCQGMGADGGISAR